MRVKSYRSPSRPYSPGGTPPYIPRIASYRLQYLSLRILRAWNSLSELNLHNVRRELILMMELFEEAECADCFQVKCKCVKTQKTDSGSIKSEESQASEKNSTDDKEQKEAEEIVEEESLGQSTPEKEDVTKNIEAWIEAASKVEEEVKTFPVDLKEQLPVIKEDKASQIQNIVSRTSAVEAFFKYFKVPPATGTVSFVTSRLAAACSKSSRQNYSYF
ncbi:unnamed protein product [Danaus chrysippus]|uniref:(African queen) hypothetical protein n=1 Tax=Danaus chrysippus TaxID=151541 RepID=A0A8J2W470_9NEOP|nr:unnamed protein product [Danaus chrysippus]